MHLQLFYAQLLVILISTLFRCVICFANVQKINPVLPIACVLTDLNKWQYTLYVVFYSLCLLPVYLPPLLYCIYWWFYFLLDFPPPAGQKNANIFSYLKGDNSDLQAFLVQYSHQILMLHNLSVLQHYILLSVFLSC